MLNLSYQKKTLNSLKKIIKTESSVFLYGEKGSGREFLAKKIHSESNRFFKNFKVLDFNNILESEIESEIFGKEESQIVKKNGIFEEVNGGTLFIKNLDFLNSKNQGRLLRVFEEKKNIEELVEDLFKKLIFVLFAHQFHH